VFVFPGFNLFCFVIGHHACNDGNRSVSQTLFEDSQGERQCQK
jgi:hypothetical protein